MLSRYTYEPYSQSTNDYPESELPILAGDYVLVWGEMDEDGYLEAELMDGRRGLVPSNYITKLVGEDLMEFHQSMVIGTSGIAGQGEIADDGWSTSIPQVSDVISPYHLIGYQVEIKNNTKIKSFKQQSSPCRISRCRMSSATSRAAQR